MNKYRFREARHFARVMGFAPTRAHSLGDRESPISPFISEALPSKAGRSRNARPKLREPSHSAVISGPGANLDEDGSLRRAITRRRDDCIAPRVGNRALVAPNSTPGRRGSADSRWCCGRDRVLTGRLCEIAGDWVSGGGN